MICRSWLFAACCCFALTLNSQPLKAAEAHRQTWWTSWEFSLGGRSNPAYDLNVPLSVRAIPRHPDDGWLAGYPEANNPLPESMYVLPRRDVIELTVAKALNRFCSVGILYGTDMSGQGKSAVDRYQQNQYGTSDRGYGTSLRYYERSNSDMSQFGLIGYLNSPWAKYKVLRARVRVGGFYGLISPSIVYKNGWDRYNSDQQYSTQTVARLHQDNIFVRGEIGGIIVNSDYPRGLGIVSAYVQFDQRTDRWTTDLAAPDFIIRQRPSSSPAITGGFTFSFF